jgi:hypothetical protein
VLDSVVASGYNSPQSPPFPSRGMTILGPAFYWSNKP